MLTDSSTPLSCKEYRERCRVQGYRYFIAWITAIIGVEREKKERERGRREKEGVVKKGGANNR